MAAVKRDLKNFDDFPGELDEGTGYHSFPCLWHKDDANRWRMWQIHIRLIKDEYRLSGIDWNLLEEKQVPIKSEYYDDNSKIPDGIVAQLWVQTGIEGGKITQQSPTYVDTISNENKANERNVFQGALIIARAQWEKRKEKGGSVVKAEKKQSSTNVMYFPMLARTFKDSGKNIEYPAYIQPKLDGIRALVFLRKYNGGIKSVVMYTRAKKMFQATDYIRKILYPYLNALYDQENDQSIYLDGEVYKHGKKLQDINSSSRNEKSDTSTQNIDRNEYHIYDCFYPKELDSTFEHRHKQLVALYEALDEPDARTIKRVPTFKVKNLTQAEKKYSDFTKLGYEGAMLRNADGEYLASALKTGTFLRSRDLVKMKQKFSDEYEVVGYTEGSKGKDKGAIIWICQTPAGDRFNVTPKDITYAQRYELFSSAEENFKKKYANRMMTVEYEDLSKTNIPQRAKAVGFRDYE